MNWRITVHYSKPSGYYHPWYSTRDRALRRLGCGKSCWRSELEEIRLAVGCAYVVSVSPRAGKRFRSVLRSRFPCNIFHYPFDSRLKGFEKANQISIAVFIVLTVKYLLVTLASSSSVSPT